MKFAHFTHIWAKPNMTPHERYERALARAAIVRRTRLRPVVLRRASRLFAPTRAGCRRRSLSTRSAPARGPKRMRIGPMGYIVPLLSSAPPCRGNRHRRSDARRPHGARPSAESINPDYFRPFGLDYGQRKSPTLEFVDYMRAAFNPETQPFSYHGREFHTDNAQISVMPAQRPHPPLWMMSRDPADAGILRQARRQSRLLSGLSAFRCRAAPPQVFA